MKRIITLVSVFSAFLFLSSTAWAQSSGNFTYATTGPSGTTEQLGNVGCTLLSNGSLSGGMSNCSVSSSTQTGYEFLGTTCTGPTDTTSCAGVSGAECLADSFSSTGYECAVSSTVSFSCKNNNDCLNIFGSNSGATCSSGTCTLPNTGTAGCTGGGSTIIKTSSGSGNILDVRPSAVVGLLTDVTISSRDLTSSGIATSSALAGIDFKVTATPDSGQPDPDMTPNGPITYDARFVQISTNLFQAIASQCAASTGGCFLTFAESTASAHSFDWLIGANATGLASGDYTINVTWGPSSGFAVSGLGEAAACVGPVNLTVEQNKVFHFNSPGSLN